MAKMKKIFTGLILIILLMGVVSASLIATIGMTGLNFVNPTAATVVKGVLCVTSPIGIISCVEQYVEGKVIGFISGEVLQAIAELSPEAARAIIIYNQVQGYIDKGAFVLENLELNEKGEIERGILEFDENEYSLAFESFFGNLTVEDIIVSKSEYNSETKELTIKEGGFLKIKIKDEEGEERELIYKNIKEGGIFKLNEEGLIEEADFVVSGDNSVYKFGDNDAIKVNTDAHILYKDGKVRVSGRDMNFLYGDLNITLNKNFIDFFGNKVFCIDCKIDEVELKALPGTFGSLTISDKGYLINSGEVIYKQNKFSVREDKNAVLIANRDTNMLDYNGNWLRQTSKTLEVQSGEEGYIKVDFLENHEILNTDDRDKGYVEIIEGDGLKFINRNDEGLIPRVIHKSSEKGYTSFVNDNLGFEFEKDMFVMDPPKPLTLEEIQNEKYQSIAMEIESDSPNIQKNLRINSYRQFCLLSEDNQELITFNKYGLPCSARLEDNELQTIEQLREKYPGIEFEVPEKEMYKNSFEDEKNVPPYLLYLTDFFFETNPECNKFDKIEYTNIPNAHVLESTLMIGRKVVDSSEPEFSHIREITKPLQVLEHECDHRLDFIIVDEEEEYLRNLPGLTGARIKRLFNQRYALEKELDELANQGNVEEMIEDPYGAGLEFLRKDFEINKINNKIYDIYSKKYPTKKTLEQLYVEVAISQRDRIYDDEDFGSLLEYLEKFEISDRLEGIDEDKKNKIKFYLDHFYTNVNVYKISKTMRDLEKKERFKEGTFSDISQLYDLITREPNLKDMKQQMDQFFQLRGFPSVYSLKNYGYPFRIEYRELASTYKEQPIKERRRLLNSANPLVSNIYKKLTQLAFDSGKMYVEEYRAIMGNICERDDCLDMLCVKYKLMCCVEHPNSPNC